MKEKNKMISINENGYNPLVANISSEQNCFSSSKNYCVADNSIDTVRVWYVDVFFIIKLHSNKLT